MCLLILSLPKARVGAAGRPSTLRAPIRLNYQSIRRLDPFGHSSYRLRLCLCLRLSIRLGSNCLCLGLGVLSLGLTDGCSRPFQSCQSRSRLFRKLQRLLGQQNWEVHDRNLGKAFGIHGLARFQGVMPDQRLPCCSAMGKKYVARN